MKKAYRDIYFWFIFILTIILIPMLLLYASGYRINKKKMQVVKTGSLYIETIPKNASLYVNGDFNPKKTPVLINNLIPGEYSVKINFDGYFSWEKKLDVLSMETTFVKELNLLKNAEPKKISKDNYPAMAPQENMDAEIASVLTELNISPKINYEKYSNLLTILDEKTRMLYIVELNNDAMSVKKFGSAVTNFAWNQKHNLLLYYNPMEIWVYYYDTMQEELITRQSEAINEAVWLSDDYIIYSENSAVKAIELDNRDLRQTYELVSINNAYNFTTNKKQKNLFYETDDNFWELSLMN
ncbi:MAG: PEGA domain-containing protein [Patescibacteria group bacterium]